MSLVVAELKSQMNLRIGRFMHGSHDQRKGKRWLGITRLSIWEGYSQMISTRQLSFVTEIARELCAIFLAFTIPTTTWKNTWCSIRAACWSIISKMLIHSLQLVECIERKSIENMCQRMIGQTIDSHLALPQAIWTWCHVLNWSMH